MAGDRLLDDERTARAELRSAVDELRAAEIETGVRRRSRLWWLMTIVTVAAVVAAAVGTTMWVRAARSYSDSDFQRAAVARVSLLLSADHRRPDQARRILDGATGAFYDEFAQSADGYSRFVQSQGTVARGDVDGAGVSGRSGDEAAVLVAATVEFAGDTPAGRKPAVRQFRLRVLVAPDDGQLKLSAVQYIP
ncbi:hypothetical protein GTV32_21410 [Gordonia sp. SID5947]|uniref:hypothetical protein n=1 Tax=Gordonia sp. SID5947 TaxID=2690315 RepID=UPI00136CC3DB|nr:hypothetical protein [Gordonia sp. SID5947]MYR08709.1 hypothetical protein [Gordonia sp. SID5947]